MNEKKYILNFKECKKRIYSGSSSLIFVLLIVSIMWELVCIFSELASRGNTISRKPNYGLIMWFVIGMFFVING